jgi:hypothetical protein
METYRTFPNAQAARDYRYENGTGGWIFVPDEPIQSQADQVILFPPEYTPALIFRHPFTVGKSGRLIGCQ